MGAGRLGSLPEALRAACSCGDPLLPGHRAPAEALSERCDADLSSHSHALRVLHEREAPVDGVCRVSRGRPHHQILPEGKTSPAALASAARHVQGAERGHGCWAWPSPGEGTCLLLFCQLRLDKATYCPLIKVVLSLKIMAFRSQKSL